MLRKHVPDPSHVLSYEPLQLCKDLIYEEVPVKILAREEKELRNKKMSKFYGEIMQWKRQHRKETKKLKPKILNYLASSNFKDEIILKGMKIVISSL